MGHLHCSEPGCTCNSYTPSSEKNICANCGHSFFKHNRAGEGSYGIKINER